VNQSLSTIPEWIQEIQAEGRYTFSRLEAQSATGRSTVAAQAALRRLSNSGRIVSPRRGFFVIVPPEYRVAGAPPPSWFIDDLMGFLGQPYYVALLSAAAIHGASHQQPMTFQVLTSAPIRPVAAGRVQIQFFTSGLVEKVPVVDVQTETGTMRVATPAVTAFDLVHHPRGTGYLSNTATVLIEMAEEIDVGELVELAPLYRIPDVQRLGFLLDFVGETKLAEPMADWLRSRHPRKILLRPDRPLSEFLNSRWRVLINEDLELDQ